MKRQLIKSFSIVGVLALVFTLASPRVSQAVIIPPGCDFLTTQPGASFGGAPFLGVPLGIVNLAALNCGLGLANLGTTDTIVRHIDPADTLNPTQIPIEMVALHLMSANAFDPDGPGPLPTATYFVTLQSERGGPASTGTMTINPTTFTSTINVCFDLRSSLLTGPLVLSLCDTLRSDTDGNPLTLDPIPWCLNQGRFSPGCGGIFTERGVDFSAIHPVRVTVPEPSALLLLGFGLLALAALRRMKLFKKM
jgi:hypothetical protein